MTCTIVAKITNVHVLLKKKPPLGPKWNQLTIWSESVNWFHFGSRSPWAWNKVLTKLSCLQISSLFSVCKEQMYIAFSLGHFLIFIGQKWHITMHKIINFNSEGAWNALADVWLTSSLFSAKDWSSGNNTSPCKTKRWLLGVSQLQRTGRTEMRRIGTQSISFLHHQLVPPLRFYR